MLQHVVDTTVGMRTTVLLQVADVLLFVDGNHLI